MTVNQGNRGMVLETLLEATNRTYRHKGMAIIHKRPTPVKILKVLTGGKVQGHLEKASTVDYDGVYRGRAIQFEAKSTRENTRFDLKNFDEHQIKHLRDADKHGAISFAVVYFEKMNKTFYLPANRLLKAWDDRFVTGRKSIPYEEFDLFCPRIRSGRGVPLDYLAVIDKFDGLVGA